MNIIQSCAHKKIEKTHKFINKFKNFSSAESPNHEITRNLPVVNKIKLLLSVKKTQNNFFVVFLDRAWVISELLEV